MPSGDLTIVFSGSGVDARISIADVSDREQIRMTVSVHGNSADLDDHEREKPDHRAEVEGRIVSVSCGPTSTLVVGRERQTTVIIPPGTPIHHGHTPLTCSQLTVGLRVHVKGARSGDSVSATEVKVQGDPGPREEHEVEVRGTVSAVLSRSCATNALTFTVLSSGTATTVTTNASTRFEHTTCATLSVNDRVEVEGTQTASGMLARKVEGEDDDDDDDDREHRNTVELKGTLGAWNAQSCPAVTSTVGGRSFSTTAATKFEGATCATLKQGDTVEVEGTRQTNGSVLAAEVEKKR